MCDHSYLVSIQYDNTWTRKMQVAIGVGRDLGTPHTPV